ncbi:hypothetical protein IU11_06345 [Cellulosimicrobium sp. MM]|nr:hypothetical protein IU11_06345 [Cellulosimicrobium sp. MM]
MPVWGVVVLLWTGVTALRVLPVLLQVPRGLLRRTLHRTPFRGGTVVAIAVGWAGVLAGLALLYVVRDAVAVRWFLVGLGTVLALDRTSASARGDVHAGARARYLPPGRREPADRGPAREPAGRRRAPCRRPRDRRGRRREHRPGRGRARGRRPWRPAAVAYVLPLVVGTWAAWRVAARQRAVSDERRGR